MVHVFPTHPDLKVACDTSRSPIERIIAWDKYELAQWLDAHVERGLQINQLDGTPMFSDGESMRTRVLRKMRRAEPVAAIDPA